MKKTAALSVLGLVMATVVACENGDNGGQPGAEGFGHVHALSVDPRTAELYVATHYGLYRIDEDQDPVRVSETAMDLMGFAIVDSSRFVASGHPAPGDDLPGNLGLIESTDGGVTWQSRSLPGVADFHGLHAAHGALYGYNSVEGAFMVSADGVAWEHRSLTVIGAFAISPTDPDLVVAVGRNGLQRSTDGARTWHLLADPPPVGVLTWGEESNLVGVDAVGTVWHSADSGDAWHRRGNVGGSPEAATAAGSMLLVAVAGDRIVASDDGGHNWHVRYPRT